MLTIVVRAAFSIALLGLLAVSSMGQDWTRFRGPNGSGISEATTVASTWTDEDYNWHVELPGVGHSSPVLWGDRIFLMSAVDDGQQRMVLCLRSKDGKLLWSKRYDADTHKKHSFNSFASPTPTVDSQRVYTLWADPTAYVVTALDHDGNEIWRRDFGPFHGTHGVGTSPILYKDMLIIGKDEDKHSALFAVDRRTGEDRWAVQRDSARVAYSTPCLLELDGAAPQLIFCSLAYGMSSIDAETGRHNWDLPVFDMRTVSSPVVSGDLILGSSGSGGGGNVVVAVKAANPMSAAMPEEIYRVKKSAPYVPTTLVYDDMAFLWGDGGVVTCINVADGNVVWRKRVGGKFYGSPVCVDGRLYCISESGDVVVLAAARTFRKLGRMPLGEECRSTPAVAGGVMYLRTVSHLYSLGEGNQ